MKHSFTAFVLLSWIMAGLGGEKLPILNFLQPTPWNFLIWVTYVFEVLAAYAVLIRFVNRKIAKFVSFIIPIIFVPINIFIIERLEDLTRLS